MQHPDEGTIHAWLDGALSAEEAARVDAHVKECAQCQAAVAEARGFIAASSRILTALDNVPRGVIPAAAERRVQPWVWRVAATVLVVAGATLALVERKDETTYHVTSARVPVSDSQALAYSAVGKVALSPPESTAGTRNAPAAVSAFSPRAMAIAPPAIVKPIPQPSAQSMKSIAKTDVAGRLGGAQTRERAAALDERQAAAVEQNRSEPTAQNAAPPPMLRAPSLAMDAATAAPRAVATKRTIGRTETFYELTPGDTVVLEEQFSAELQGVVAGGAAKRGQALSGRAAGQATAEQQKSQPSPASAPVALQDAQSSEIHRISWLDRSSGRVLVLSGRHSQEELQQIRERIQELRDAVQSKKNPD